MKKKINHFSSCPKTFFVNHCVHTLHSPGNFQFQSCTALVLPCMFL